MAALSHSAQDTSSCQAGPQGKWFSPQAFLFKWRSGTCFHFLVLKIIGYIGMPRKQDELLSYDCCYTTQPSFLGFRGEFKDNCKWCVSAPSPAMGTFVRFAWVNFLVSPYQLHKTLQFSFSHTLGASNATTVEIICGASKWPCQPSSAHTNWNYALSRPLSTAAGIHLPFFSIVAGGALTQFTWLPSRA